MYRENLLSLLILLFQEPKGQLQVKQFFRVGKLRLQDLPDSFDPVEKGASVYEHMFCRLGGA